MGGVGQVSGGALCSGTTVSTGSYFYGGEGLGGEGQISVGSDGSVGYGRGIMGPSVGAGGGGMVCVTHNSCMRN